MASVKSATGGAGGRSKAKATSPAPAPAPSSASGAPGDGVADTTKVAAAPRRGIEVTGPRAGRRRAGHAFGPTPVTLAVDDLPDGALAAIFADQTLTVADVEIEAV